MRPVFPDINLNINDTILGIGSYIMRALKERALTIDECHNKTNIDYQSINGIYLDFNTYLISIVFLFSLDILFINDNGEVYLK